MIHWNALTDLNQISEIIEISFRKPIAILKHSTRCSISQTALDRLNRSGSDQDSVQVDWYFLDLLQFRPVSNQLEETFGVKHESPQILVISQGKCLFHQSHLDIRFSAILEMAPVKN